MSRLPAPVPPVQVERRILVVRDQRVMVDADLAALYGVATKVLLQAVKRNISRFPEDFMFHLDTAEWDALRSQFVTSKPGSGGRRYAPYAFTEQGVAMLSSVLNSPQAIAANIEIMRAFVRLREIIASNKELSRRLDELESKSDLMEVQHETFAHSTRVQLKQVFDALRELMAPPANEAPPKRPIGFVPPEEKPAKPKARKTQSRQPGKNT